MTWEITSGAETTRRFGDCTTYYTSSSEISIPNRAMHYNVNWSDKDIEGWALQDYVNWRDNEATYCAGLGSIENQIDDA